MGCAVAVGGGGGGGRGGCGECDGGDVVVGFGRVGLFADDGEPVYGAVLVGVDAEAGEVGEGLCALEVVEGAEEAVAAAVEPGVGEVQAVAD